MTDLYANSTEFVGSVTLASAIGADETSFAFHGTIPASLRGGTSRWRVGNELVIATIDAGGTSPMTVVRGAEGSTAASHTPSTRLRHYMTAAQFRVVDGAAQKASNLSDLASAATARTNLGLGSVDNTSDPNKPVSTAQQAALDLKAPKADPMFTGTVLGVTKAHVGLVNVDNTSDANKPVSTAADTRFLAVESSRLLTLAYDPDALLVGALTRDTNGALTGASAVWPDGATGVYSGTASTDFPGAIDAYTITHILNAVTTTYTQSALTRDTNGAVTARPAIVVS